uniref:Uncharacterized protein n=1 Tax=Myotis myotis TaxID=51298 RepID=A0A7J7XI65_MYOMY|nr:hypothetical protein mMyoMyo1_011590 [Myotis myotis]
MEALPEGRCHRSPSLVAAQGGAGPTRVLAAPSRYLCPEVTLPLRTILTQTCCYGAACRPARRGLGREDTAARPLAASLSFSPGRFLCFANSCHDGFVLQAWLPRWASVLGAARPCSAPGLGETSPPACPLTKAATWGPREGLRRPLRVAAVHPLGRVCPGCRLCGRWGVRPGTTAPSSTAAPRPHHPTRHSCFKESGVTPSTSSELK